MTHIEDKSNSRTVQDDPGGLTIYEELDQGPCRLYISISDDMWIFNEPVINQLYSCQHNELEIYHDNDWKCESGFNPGFSLDLPFGDMVISGSFFVGKAVFKNADTCISISWIKDPGIKPMILLADLISKNGLINSPPDFSSIMAGDRPAVAANVQFMGNRLFARAELVAWISERSDRLFIASVAYPSGGYSRIKRAFHAVINGFIDASIASYLLPRPTLMDGWAICLRDLLCSYAYNSSDNPVCREVNMRMRISSNSGVEGLYEYGVELSSIASRELLKRAALVWKILADRGYQVKLMQRGGNIWLLVSDPSGNWQAVSLNLREPRRMIGALVNSQGDPDKWHSGVCYDDYPSLARDNDTDVSANESGIKRLCETSQPLCLRPPGNRDSQEVRELDELLNQYIYRNMYYKKGIFSCANTSQILWAFLKDNGYDARLVCSFDDHPMPRHMWLIARPALGNEFVAIEATVSNLRGQLLSLGCITFDDKYYTGIMYNSSLQYSILYPQQGMNLEPNDGIMYIYRKVFI